MFLGKNMRRILSLLLVCLLFTFACLGVSSNFDAEASSVSSLQQQDEELKRRNEELNGQISSTQSEQEKQKAEQEKLSKQMEDLQEQINTLMTQISKLESSIKAKEKEIIQKEEQIKQTYELFKVRLRSMYMEGDTSALDMLLSAADFSQFLANIEYGKRVSQQTNDLMDQLATEKSELEEAKAALNQDKEDLDAANVSLKERRSELQSTYDKSVEKSAELANTEAYLVEELSDVEEQRAAVEDEIKKAIAQAQAQAQQNNTSQGSGSAGSGGSTNSGNTNTGATGTPSSSGFIWPTPSFSLITSPFGYRTHPITGVQQLHKGIDISGSGIRGTSALASKSGTVLAHPSDPYGYGIYVLIDHGDGTATLYAHLDQAYVSAGEYVSQGQAIGAVGNTGGSTGPHLHFEVRINGTCMNPLNYVNQP